MYSSKVLENRDELPFGHLFGLKGVCGLDSRIIGDRGQARMSPLKVSPTRQWAAQYERVFNCQLLQVSFCLIK